MPLVCDANALSSSISTGWWHSHIVMLYTLWSCNFVPLTSSGLVVKKKKSWAHLCHQKFWMCWPQYRSPLRHSDGWLRFFYHFLHYDCCVLVLLHKICTSVLWCSPETSFYNFTKPGHRSNSLQRWATVSRAGRELPFCSHFEGANLICVNEPGWAQHAHFLTRKLCPPSEMW